MRALLSAFFAACAVIGIPWVVNEVRGGLKETGAPAPLAIRIPHQSQPVPIAFPQLSSNASPEKTPPVQLVSLQRNKLPLLAAASRPASSSEAELVSAIQKELARLDYYGGPITDRWSKAARLAARHFIRASGNREHNPSPTAELLAALQSTSATPKQTASARRPAQDDVKPVRSSEAPLKEITPKKEVLPKASTPAPEPAAQNDDYLPPWMSQKAGRMRVSSKENAKIPADTVPEAVGRTAHEAPEAEDEPQTRRHHKRHRVERPAKSRGHYASYRGYRNFSGYGGSAYRGRSLLFPF